MSDQGIADAVVRRSVRVSSRKGRVEVIAEPAMVSSPTRAASRSRSRTTATGSASRRGARPLVVRVPEGTDVVVGTVSGRVTCSAVRHVAVNTVSAAASRSITAARVDARTVSGRVSIGSCSGEVRCRRGVGSGRGRRGGSGLPEHRERSHHRSPGPGQGQGPGRVGRIQVGVTESPVDVKVECVNGADPVRVPAGAARPTRLRSKRGSVTSALGEGTRRRRSWPAR
jgi:hypothetical protein